MSYKVTEKKHYRTWAKEIRAKLGQSGLQKISMTIEHKVRELTEFKRANTIMAYMATKIEVSLEGLFKTEGKKWFVPVINSDDSIFIVPYVQGETKLVEGRFHILQPETTGNNFCNQTDKQINLDIIFVPGLCFDKNGNRVGFGKGYYDKFLKLNPKSLKIGCCPKECFVEALPTDLWDEKVDLVITD